MDKCIRIADSVEHLFPNPKAVQQAGQILEGMMAARSPRLSDIAAHMPGNPDACYKRIQRFLQHNHPQEALRLLFNEAADFVIGDPTAIERPHADKTEYVGTLMDGTTSGFGLLTLATPLRGRALPLH